MGFNLAFKGLICLHSAFILSLSRAFPVWRDVREDAGFLRDKDGVIGVTK